MTPGLDLDVFHVGALVERLLGRSIDVLGEHLELWTREKVENLGRIGVKAKRKLGDSINLDGQVSSRVIIGLLREGPYCDDELMAEYLGGVLASARSPISRDDRGASFVSLIGRLSTYQVRTHYIFYEVAHGLLAGQDFAIEDSSVRHGLASIYVPRPVYDSAMEFSDDEDGEAILNHSVAGLVREGLIEDSEWGFGTKEQLEGNFPLVPLPDGTSCVIFTLSPLGMELYLVAQGIRDVRERDFLNPDVQLVVEPPISIPTGSDTTWHMRISEVQKRSGD